MNSPDHLRQALDGIPDPVRIIGKDGEVLIRNEAAEKQFPDGLGHLCDRDNGRGYSSCPTCQAAEVLESGAPRRWHVALPRPGKSDARDYYEVTLGAIHTQDGEVSGVLEILRDVTATLGLEQHLIGEAERQEEEMRRRAAEVKNLTARASSLRTELGALRETQTEILFKDRLLTLGGLVAGVAHEVHTPLGAVLSCTDLLARSVTKIRETVARKDCDRKSCDALIDRLDAMDSAVQLVSEGSRRIKQVIHTLRMYSRLDEADLMEANLNEGIDSTISLAGYKIGDRIKVIREYGSLPAIICRPDALNQVFMNLLLNAVQAIPGNGEIRIRTVAGEDEILVEFTDTGTGIEQDDLPRIFDLGFTTKKRGEGSGLGLPICKRIVEDHGGSIVASRNDAGETKFSVRLPSRPAREELDEQAAE